MKISKELKKYFAVRMEWVNNVNQDGIHKISQGHLWASPTDLS